EVQGGTMESHYADVPAPLRGFVELTFDMNHHAGFRLLEGLLYRSPYYSTAGQALSISLQGERPRPFILATPRLDGPDRLIAPLPFASPGIDVVGQAFHRPVALAALRTALGVPAADTALLRSFLTETPPVPTAPFTGPGMRVRFFGHACLLIETADVSILIDPMVPTGASEGAVHRFRFQDLPAHIDYVLITHAHADHCNLETLLPLRHRIGQVIVPKAQTGGLFDPSLKLMLTTLGFGSVRDLDEMEAVPVAGGQITALPFLGEHADLPISCKVGYGVQLLGKTVVVLADSRNLDVRLYEHLRAAIGEVDALFLGMGDGAPGTWLYRPLLLRGIARRDDQVRRLTSMDDDRAAGVVTALQPRQVYVYAMGLEPWLVHVTGIEYEPGSPIMVEMDRFLDRCRADGRQAECLRGRRDLHI
ncbi:MAG: MBL fold metallo-hydrolase, partial [Candidatus Sericytochromatia bacterium]|nr:MBL fold metallo-hydrolase [Candidatus Sericytochromatia bacterium]